MTRILSIELRRSNALSLAALLIGVGVAWLLLNSSLWQSEWLKFGYAHSSVVFLLFPLALAGGAVLGRRDKRTRADELIASTGRPKVQRLLPGLLALGVAAMVAHLLVFAGGGAVVAVTGSYVSAATVFWPLTGVLMLLGGAWLGVAAGRAWSSPAVPPLLAVLGLLLQFGFSEIGPPGEQSLLENLSALAQPPSFSWEAVTGRVLLGYTLLGAGMIAAGFLLTTGRSWLPRVAAVVALGLAGTGAAVVPGKTMADHYRVDAAAQKLVCADGTPQVCVTAVHAYALDEATPQVRKALSLLAKLPGAQTRAVEWRADEVYQPGESDWDWQGTTRTPAGTVSFDLGMDGDQAGTTITENMVLGAGTSWNGCEGTIGSVAGHASGAWLMGTEQLSGIGDGLDSYPEMQTQVRDTVRLLRALPEAEQIRRVAAMRDAAATCQDTDLLAILTGQASS